MNPNRIHPRHTGKNRHSDQPRTPDAPTPDAVRRYLKEFLSDPRVVEMPRALLWLILNGIILNTRPKKSAAKYAKVWLKEGSPLRVYTEKQTALLQGYLSQHTKAPFVVDYAMRYGNPSIPSVLAKLKAQNCQRILVVPMYPQYAASTTATVCDIVFDELKQMRNMPALRTIRNFHDHPGYIKALANSINDYWMKHGRPEKLLMSFHGLPKGMLDKGDPYHCECQKTARLLAQQLGLKPEQYAVSFQSRLGNAEWLKPYRDQGTGNKRSNAWTWSVPASSPIAWKHWKRSHRKARRISSMRAVANTTTSPASMTAMTGCTR